MLQRIYGVCFPTPEEIEAHLQEIEEAKMRDHRKIGKDLSLFMLSDYGPGLPFWLPKGYKLRRTLENYWLDLHYMNDYQVINTPIMLNRELPIRIGEFATDFRYEASGAVKGLERVRCMCQIDAHLFVRPDQIADDFK